MLVEGVAVKGVYRQKMGLGFFVFGGFGRDGGRGGFAE